MKNALLVLLLLTVQTVWSQSKKEKQVAAAVVNLNKALVAADSTMLRTLTATKLSYGHSSGALENKQTFVHNAVYGPFKFLSVATSNQTIAMSKNSAMVRHIFIAKAENNGVPTDLKIGVLQLWQKQKAAGNYGRGKLINCKIVRRK